MRLTFCALELYTPVKQSEIIVWYGNHNKYDEPVLFSEGAMTSLQEDKLPR